jgi:RNA polymerase sigma-70 factor (ECF subfamily)
MLGPAFDDVLLAAQTGAGWAFAKLYEELAGVVTGYVRRQGAREPDDVASETFLDVFRGIRSFEGDEESFRSWVFTIAHRRLVDERRRAARRPATTELDDRALDWVDDVDDGGPESVVDAADARDRLDEHLATLTEEQRDVVLLRVIGGLSVAETATAVGRSEAAVRQLQRRALRALEERIGVDGPGADDR